MSVLKDGNELARIHEAVYRVNPAGKGLEGSILPGKNSDDGLEVDPDPLLFHRLVHVTDEIGSPGDGILHRIVVLLDIVDVIAPGLVAGNHGPVRRMDGVLLGAVNRVDADPDRRRRLKLGNPLMHPADIVSGPDVFDGDIEMVGLETGHPVGIQLRTQDLRHGLQEEIPPVHTMVVVIDLEIRNIEKYDIPDFLLFPGPDSLNQGVDGPGEGSHIVKARQAVRPFRPVDVVDILLVPQKGRQELHVQREETPGLRHELGIRIDNGNETVGLVLHGNGAENEPFDAFRADNLIRRGVCLAVLLDIVQNEEVPGIEKFPPASGILAADGHADILHGMDPVRGRPLIDAVDVVPLGLVDADAVRPGPVPQRRDENIDGSIRVRLVHGRSHALRKKLKPVGIVQICTHGIPPPGGSIGPQEVMWQN